MSDLTQEAPSLIGVGAQSIVDRANSLGLTWTIRPAVVTRPVSLNAESDIEIMYDGDTASVGCVNLSGLALIIGNRVMAIGVPPSANYIVGLTQADTWHPFVFENGWHASSAAAVSGQYRLVSSPSNSVQIVGEILAGTVANDTTVTTVPQRFRPLRIVSFPVATNPHPTTAVVGPLMQLKPSGILTIWGAPAGSGVYINAIVPLDAL